MQLLRRGARAAKRVVVGVRFKRERELAAGAGVGNRGHVGIEVHLAGAEGCKFARSEILEVDVPRMLQNAGRQFGTRKLADRGTVADVG